MEFPFKKVEHLGIYETPSILAEFLVKNTLDIHFDKNKTNFLNGIQESNTQKIVDSIRKFQNFTICDPMVGSGIFVKEIISYLVELRNWFIQQSRKNNLNLKITQDYPLVFTVSQTEFIEHLLTHSIYGVDLDVDNLEDCKFTLAKILMINKNTLDSNFKNGNSLIDSFNSDHFKLLIDKEYVRIISLISLRNKSKNQSLNSSDIKKYTQIKNELLKKIKSDPNYNLIPTNISKDYFSWPLEFPEIFFDENGKSKKRPGFDIVIGNPPWKVLKPDDREFFERIQPGFSTLKRKQRDDQKKKLIKNFDVNSNYKLYLESIKQYSKYFVNSNSFRYQGGRNSNLYKISLERFYQLTTNGGLIGAVTPLGIATDLGTSQFRKMIFDHCVLYFIIGFEPKSKFFKNADVSSGISVFKKGKSTKQFSFVSGFVSPVDVKIEKLPKISVDFVYKTSPESLSIPSVKSDYDISILEKMYSFPTLGTVVDGMWNVDFSRELDETNSRHLFQTTKTKIPLIKGGNISPYKMKKPPFIWVKEKEFKKISKDYEFNRIVWRDVARPNLKNRLIATMISSGCALGNSLNYIKPNIPEDLKYYLLAFLNSSIAEYRIKQITSNSHINQFVIKQLSVPRFDSNNPLYKKIVKLSKKLSSSDLNEIDFHVGIKEMDEYFAQAYDLNSDESQYITKMIIPDDF
jgi:Alw26I/Eco31I/Esp3I family type II restriction m6 adenine DNA methyltransferase